MDSLHKTLSANSITSVTKGICETGYYINVSHLLAGFSNVGNTLPFTASQCKWCSDPCCLDYLRQSNLLYPQAGPLRLPSIRGEAASWQLKTMLAHNEMSELRAREERRWPERKGVGVGIKDLDYGVECTEERRRRRRRRRSDFH